MSGVSVNGVVSVVKKYPLPIAGAVLLGGAALWFLTSSGSGGGAPGAVMVNTGPSEALQAKALELGLSKSQMEIAQADRASDRAAQLEIAKLNAASTAEYNKGVMTLEGRKIDAGITIAQANNAAQAAALSMQREVSLATLASNKELALADLTSKKEVASINADTQLQLAAQANALAMLGLQSQERVATATVSAGLEGKRLEAATTLEQTKLLTAAQVASTAYATQSAKEIAAQQSAAQIAIAQLSQQQALGIAQMSAFTNIVSAKQANRSNFLGFRF